MAARTIQPLRHLAIGLDLESGGSKPRLRSREHPSLHRLELSRDRLGGRARVRERERQLRRVGASRHFGLAIRDIARADIDAKRHALSLPLKVLSARA
jgi:hypothetical protein